MELPQTQVDHHIQFVKAGNESSLNNALQTGRVGGGALWINPPNRQGRFVAALPETISHSGTIRERSPALDEALHMG